MFIPNWVQKELQLINHKYFAVYDERQRSVAVCKWTCSYPRIRTWPQDSFVICRVHYRNLDNRFLTDIRRGLYWATKTKELIQKIDASNAALYENANKEDEYISRYMAKRIWHYYKEPMVI